MKRAGSFVGDWWRLASPYFKSEERFIAILLLVAVVVLTLSSVWLEVLFNDWYRRFYDALEKKNEVAFWIEIKVFTWLAFLFIVAGVARFLVRPYLELRWRR